MGGFGMSELLVIFFIVMLLFGASKLPALGDGMGRAIRSLKDAMNPKEEPPARKPEREAESSPPERRVQ